MISAVGKKKFSSTFHVLPAGLIIKPTWDRVTKENNQI